MPDTNPLPPAGPNERAQDVEALIERRQEQVEMEKQRQEERLAAEREIAKTEHAGLSAELKVIEQKRAAATVWRAEQKEKKRQLALDRIRKQQALEHELKLKAEAELAREKNQQYMDTVHKIAAERRFKATQKAALHEEEETVDDAERHAHMLDLQADTSYQMATHDVTNRAEQRIKELKRQFDHRRLELDQWLQRQVAQITGISGPMSPHDRLTPDQRRRVQHAEQEHARSLESVALEERQQLQAVESNRLREQQAADRLHQDRLNVANKALQQSKNDAGAKREDLIQRAEVRAHNWATFGNKQADSEKEKAAKEQSRKVANRQPRGLF